MADESILGPTMSPDNKVHKASPTAANALSPITQNARSCVTCRKRKVKCDKKHPCNHCTRQGIECSYPPPGRAARKPRKPQDAALVERLRRLEAVVQTLGAQVTEEGDSSVSPKEGDMQDTPVEESVESPEEKMEKMRKWRKEFKELHWAKVKEAQEGESNVDDLTERFGTLLVKQGRSRYINPGFWSMFNAEVEDLKGHVLELSDEEEEEYSTPASQATSSTQGFIFGLSSTNVQMTLLHPPAAHISVYWETYCENVDPLIKMIHRPTREPHVLGYAKQLDNLPKDSECLLFAICYAAVTSTLPEECWQKFGESKTDLLARYRFGIEQALARADFLQTDSIFVLQAFLIFLTCLRRSSDTRLIWSLSALAVRISQGLGLHRDGSHYPKLQIYKQEMRRVIWWHTIVLDSRVCEDLGSDAAINGRMWDTRLPRNLNDSDMNFEMTTLPDSRQGCTDMTFNLIRFEIGAGFGKILKGQHKRMMHCMKGGPVSDEDLEKKRKVLVDLKNSIEEKYLKDADLEVPINWISATVSRMILSKMWLMLYQPFQRKDGGKSLPQETRDELFTRALENVEHSIEFHTEARSPKFRKYCWLLQSDTQWHAIAFLLSELCTRTTGLEVERAWKAVDFSMEMSMLDGTPRIDKPDAHLWKPLRLLRAKARAERQKALADSANTKTSQGFSNLPSWKTEPQPRASVLLDLSYARNGSLVPKPATATINGPAPWATASQPGNLTGLDTPASGMLHAMSNLEPNREYSMQPNMSHQTQFSDISAPWVDATTTSPSSGLIDNTALMGDNSMNWATWDDMVEQWGVQNDDQAEGNGMGPSFFGGGSNWF